MDIVFDIETVGCDITELSESQQEFILRFAEKEPNDFLRLQKREEAARYLSLYPLTAKVVAIGMLNTITENSLVLFQGSGNDDWSVEEKKINYKGVEEKEMLQLFWKYVKKAETVVTFNGRNFDLPFLMIRSAMHGVRPSVNLLKKRYGASDHVDLLEQFTFYGLTKKFNLDFYCQSFGIESPKSKGVSGMDVKELFNAGKIKDVAIYCGEDVKATYELYKIWKEYLNI